MPIHLEVSFEATPERVYQLLTDSAEFSAATERPVENDATREARSQPSVDTFRGARSNSCQKRGSFSLGVALTGRRGNTPSCGLP